MKFRKLGRIALATAASLFIGFGTQSCYYYTEAYVIVTGSQYNQVASYREQNQTGVLTQAPGSPLSTVGTNPIRALLLTGGRYVYVLNQGTPKTNSDGSFTWSGASIAEFSIGGDGSLSFQQNYFSQGRGSLRLALSSSGTYLYVLDQYQPAGSDPNTTPASASPGTYPCYDATAGVYRPAGDVTVFSIDTNTGRLFLVQNQQTQNSFGTPLTYFPLGCGVIDFHFLSNYLYTAENTDPTNPGVTGQVIYAYSVNPTNGQLTEVAGGSQPIPGATNIGVLGSSASGTYLYVLDNGTNQIFTYTVGGNGLLSAISTGAVPNVPNTAGMTALTTDASSKYLYVTNTQSTALGSSSSVLAAFTITSGTGTLTPFGVNQNNAPEFGVGSGPVCVFEDPSHQYIYTANAGSSNITGAKLNPNTGTLTNLSKGSSFTTVGTPTWCLYSPNTD